MNFFQRDGLNYNNIMHRTQKQCQPEIGHTIFTKTLIHYAYDIWKFQNEKVHGTTKKEEQEHRHQQLCFRANDYQKSKKYTIVDKP